MSHPDNLCIDLDFDVFTYDKFKSDIEIKNINKICMTEVINADMMIATFGEELYAKSCKEVLSEGKSQIKALGLDKCIIYYMHNYKNFIVAGTEEISDEDFEKIMRMSYEQYEHSTSMQTEISGISRFVLVFGKENIIDRAKSAFYLNRKSQNNYIIASNEKAVLAEETNQSVKTLELINYAINNDAVVPFYQGIYNNELKRIDRYEALIRLYDSEGKIYFPGSFLDVAKKFKMYNTLSKCVIDKALSDFENKSYSLSINISLYDVENADFASWFIDRLKNYSDPQKIIIEFVETENYNHGKLLYNFLNTVRDIGCKIAVDDFGVGFATYTSIISLKPDIIKIDGNIIKDLTVSKDCLTILDSICYMARLIDSKVVAEFVENSEIQDILIHHNVTYSQGYYFSKPLPLNEIS